MSLFSCYNKQPKRRRYTQETEKEIQRAAKFVLSDILKTVVASTSAENKIPWNYLDDVMKKDKVAGLKKKFFFWDTTDGKVCSFSFNFLTTE